MTASHFRSRWLAVLVALVVIAVLNACGGGPAPTSTRTPTPASTDTPVATPTDAPTSASVPADTPTPAPTTMPTPVPTTTPTPRAHGNARAPTNGDTCTCIYAHRIGYPHIRRGQGNIHSRTNSTKTATPTSGGDRAALVALYNATDGPNWNDNTNWLSEA